MTGEGTDSSRPPRRRARLLGLLIAALAAAWPDGAGAAEVSAEGYYRLEPYVLDNIDLDRSNPRDRRIAFVEHEFLFALTFRTGEIEAAVGFELADGIAGRQSIRGEADPFDDVTVVELSPDTNSTLVDFFWVRWQPEIVTLKAGWFTNDLDSYRFFLGRDGAPSVQLERMFGPLRVQYTFQKVAERAFITETASSVPAPRSTLVGVGDVDAHYLLLDVRRQDLGPVRLTRGALWGVYASDRRPEDRAYIGVVGGQFSLRSGRVSLYGEGDLLVGKYRGTIPVSLNRGPGTANDEVLSAGAPLRGSVAFLGLAVDALRSGSGRRLQVGVEALRGSGDRDPTDGRAEDVTSLALVHANLEGDFELSRLFGPFPIGGHSQYLKYVGNLTVVKPFVAVRVWESLEVGAAAYWLRTARSVAAVLDGAPTGEWTRDLGWQYEGWARLAMGPGVSAALHYTYLVPGPALRPGGDPAQSLYGALMLRF